MRSSTAAEREVEVEEEEEEEEFYESLDRILSSSCSSTSASDDDVDHLHSRGGRRGGRLPSFPSLASSYDVWISEPSSVQERRRQLLLQMGLAGDPELSRAKSPAPDAGVAAAAGGSAAGEAEAGSSVSSVNSSPPAVAVIVRSKSDGSVDPNRANPERPQRRAISFGSATATDKPPLVGRSWALAGGKCKEFDGNGVGEDDMGRQSCTIRNLDNGIEFVVKELREDGMWNKLKEVGTGRQLTMEEFEIFVGRSPIVQELMRRQNVEDSVSDGSKRNGYSSRGPGDGLKASAGNLRSKKNGSWFTSIKNIAGTVVTGGYYHRERRSSDERDTSSEKGGRRSSSATDDSLDGSHSLHHGPERIKVRQYGKSYKELTGLYITQAVQAHNGAIWSIKFSFDGRYLASGGEDCVIHVWKVVDSEKKGNLLSESTIKENGNCYPFLAAIANGSPEPEVTTNCAEESLWEKKRRSKVSNSRKSVSSDHLMVPEHIFALSEKPICSFKGHTEDVLDLSWSKSQYLLSSSMDKTVRLWHMSSSSCLKIFSHSDYVTCIQFNPVDDKYFISGSLDEKVRIWSIPNRQIVDWNDLHEMVTAACFTPNGQAALVGTHKGSCHLFDTSENKLRIKKQIYLQPKKKSCHKKITGFQFVPGSSSQVLVTSADSRIRVINGIELVHKFKGFRNTTSQISASVSTNGRYVICASEDSHVYMWRHDADSQPTKAKAVVNSTQSYEHFHCQDVTVAVAWPNTIHARLAVGYSNRQSGLDLSSKDELEVDEEASRHESSSLPIYSESTNCLADLNSATWPEKKPPRNELSPQSSGELCSGAIQLQSRSAWGMVIVTAGRGGEIGIYQNFGFPFRV
ncbi:hypothetical protein Cni_G03545 [Canna indica]|uniref:WD repeat-containing protein 44 n=1 Tax=Canna indica TaxID=4628 RepID=A0AAQ3Q358_9LILI|nr:hypothetical protein Cni_G03545 [Canna indica]